MGLRVFGLKMEQNYGEEVDWNNYVPDFHQEVTSADFKLNDDPNLSAGGSRMYKRGRAGVMKPTGSIEGQVDLKRVGHFFRALLDCYEFTEGSNEEMNIHEFYGGEGTHLPSFSAVQTFDIFQKQIIGLLLDGLKLEVSDEFMTFGADWIYKTENVKKIDPNDYDRLEMEGDIPLMFYDVQVKLNNKNPNEGTGIQSSFSCEIKNNHDVDKTIGLGSRYPQRRANAQQREIDLSLVTTLDEDTLDSVLDGEYGEVGALQPSSCKILKVPLELDVEICEDPDRKMTILFPECILNVEYDLSDADAIEVTIKLSAMGTGKAELESGEEVITDMYIRLENDMPEITYESEGGETSNNEETPETVNISVSVSNGSTGVQGASVSIGEITGTTGSQGGCTLQNVPVGSRTVIVTAQGYQEYSQSHTITSETDSLEIVLTPE